MILHTLQSGEGPPVALLHGLFGAARNWGAIQRAIAPHFRVVALDMRNHGDSPHASDLGYATQAEDVRETLQSLGIETAAVIGHSMGGKAAMAMALRWPGRVGRLLVADIAPVDYQHGNEAIARAMAAIPLSPTLSLQQADAMLASAVPSAEIRAFLLQNLRFGAQPRWRIGLAEITAAIADLEGWAKLPGSYAGPALFVTGDRSDYVRDEHRPIIRSQFGAARFVAVKRAGHWVHADNPAGFLSVLQAFLHDWGIPRGG
ncbi:alpha/beta fold hydrolase [Rhodopila sp.]|uniref:alpha/beta fold hydrolase n=1 Tax=Rhodopila sp. TaxID=2480087 RepID=UPI003D10CCA9